MGCFYQKIYYANPKEKVVAAFQAKMPKNEKGTKECLSEILKVALQCPLIVNDRKLDILKEYIYIEVEHLIEPKIYEDTSDADRKMYKVVAENEECYLLLSIEGDGSYAITSKIDNSRFVKIR